MTFFRDPPFGLPGGPSLDTDLLTRLKAGPTGDTPDIEVAVALAYLLYDELQKYGTGGGEVVTDADIRTELQALKAVCTRLGVPYRVPFRDFTDFRSYWMRQGASGSGGWQARRDLFVAVIGPMHEALDVIEQRSLAVAAADAEVRTVRDRLNMLDMREPIALGYADVGPLRDFADALHQWRRWADGHPMSADAVVHVVEVLGNAESIDRSDAVPLAAPLANWAADRGLDMPVRSPGLKPVDRDRPRPVIQVTNSSDDVPMDEVVHTYRFDMTISVEPGHVTHLDPEWAALAATSALTDGYGISATTSSRSVNNKQLRAGRGRTAIAFLPLLDYVRSRQLSTSGTTIPSGRGGAGLMAGSPTSRCTRGADNHDRP